MRSTLRLIVLCLAGSAAVDAAFPKNVGKLPVSSHENATAYSKVKENDAYSPEGELQDQRKRAMTGRKRILVGLAKVVGVASAMVLSYLLWRRVQKVESRVSRRFRLDDAEKFCTEGDVCVLDALSAVDLQRRTAEMVRKGGEKIAADKEKLKELKKKVGTARATHERLVTALQHREELPESSSAEEIKATEKAVDVLRASLRASVAELGADMSKFPKLEDQFLRGVSRWLTGKEEECQEIAHFLRIRSREWKNAETRFKELEEQLAAVARLESTGGTDSDELKEAREELDEQAFLVKAALYRAIAKDKSQASESRSDLEYSYVAEDDETDNDSDVKEVAVELPEMTVDELDEMATSSLTKALERLEVEAKELKQKEEALGYQEVFKGYEKLKHIHFNLELAEDGDDEEDKKRTRQAFDSQRNAVEPLVIRTRNGKPLPDDEALSVPGIFLDYVWGSLCTAQSNIARERVLQKRRQTAWERVQWVHDEFKKLKEKVADLQARERTPREEAQLESARKRLRESHYELSERLKLAKKKDGIPLQKREEYQPLTSREYESMHERQRRRYRRSTYPETGTDSDSE